MARASPARACLHMGLGACEAQLAPRRPCREMGPEMWVPRPRKCKNVAEIARKKVDSAALRKTAKFPSIYLGEAMEKTRTPRRGGAARAPRCREKEPPAVEAAPLRGAHSFKPATPSAQWTKKIQKAPKRLYGLFSLFMSRPGGPMMAVIGFYSSCWGMRCAHSAL